MEKLYQTLILLSTLTLIRSNSIYQRHNCSPNQEFVSGGTGCPLKCCEPPPTVCSTIGIIGCQCKPGFLRNSRNECVSPVECNCQCSQNQEFTTSGTACPRRCGQPPPQVCIQSAIIGCQCKAGYWLNSREECVLPEQCHECPPNAVYNNCGTACPPTCDNPNPGTCTKQCVQGCQCSQGFFKDRFGRCVRFNECKARGGGYAYASHV